MKLLNAVRGIMTEGRSGMVKLEVDDFSIII